MPLEKQQFEQESRKIDNKLTIPEKNFLKNNHTEISQDKDSFAKSFDLQSKIDLCIGKNSPKEMFNALLRSRESVALVQAYLFDDPSEIDGVLGWKTRKKIREKNNESSEKPKVATNPKQTPTNNLETRETKKEYTLSKVDFDQYFRNRDFIQDQGNCWLTSTIAGIMKRSDREGLIRSSCEIKKDDNGFDVFYFKLPLGEPGASVYPISSQAVYSKQITDDGVFPASPLKDAEPTFNMADNMKSQGIILLQLAYLKKSTGSNQIDLSQLEGISFESSGNQYLELLGSENISTEKHSKKESGFDDLLLSKLKSFNNQNQIMGLGVNGEYLSGGDINHETVLEKVSTENGVMYIYIFDPNHGAKELKKLTYTDFKKVCGDFTLVTKKGSFQNKTSDENISQVHDKRDTKPKINKTIENTVGKNGNKYDSYLREKRGNIILEALNTTGIGSNYITGVNVKSYGQSSINIGYELASNIDKYSIVYKNTLRNEYNTGSIDHFKILDNSNMGSFGDGITECILDKSAFLEPITTSSDPIEQSFERSLIYLDYFRKLGNFINFVKSEYINTGKGDGPSPFALEGDAIVFDDDISKTQRTATEYGMTISGKVLDTVHDKINILENRNGMGIYKKLDKQKIINFLNEIYKKKNTKTSSGFGNSIVMN